MTRICCHATAVLVAASYVLLGVFDSSSAAALWWEYGIVSCAMAIVNYVQTRNGHGSSRRH